MSGTSRRTLRTGGREIPVTLRRNRQARRMILRIQPAEPGSDDGVVVTLPHHVAETDALDWLATKQDWILQRLDTLSPRIGFIDGAILPFLGEPHIIQHQLGRGTINRLDGVIHVCGAPEHLSRRLIDWLRKQARQHIQQLVAAKSGQLGLPAGRVSVRDTRSRWGSCAANGNLSFCWRLIMAPEFVLDYVVAHEVAHLKEHNHSDRFWFEVSKLTDHQQKAKFWLNKNGESLRRYG